MCFTRCIILKAVQQKAILTILYSYVSTDCDNRTTRDYAGCYHLLMYRGKSTRNSRSVKEFSMFLTSRKNSLYNKRFTKKKKTFLNHTASLEPYTYIERISCRTRPAHTRLADGVTCGFTVFPDISKPIPEFRAGEQPRGDTD